MNITQRVINILKTPKTEWEVIDSETATPVSLLTGYVLPLALLSMLGSLLNAYLDFSSFAYPFSFYLKIGLVSLIGTLVSFYVVTFIFDQLATSFASEKNINKSAQLIAYSLTASYVAGFLSFIPGVGGLLVIAGFVYAIYLMYLGLGPLKKTPEDKKVIYMIVGFVVAIVVQLIIASVLTMLIIGSKLNAGAGFGL